MASTMTPLLDAIICMTLLAVAVGVACVVF